MKSGFFLLLSCSSISLASEVPLKGFGELVWNASDYPENIYRNRLVEHSRALRMTEEISKFSVDWDKRIRDDLNLLVEVEIQHQGITQDNEPNHSGPFYHRDYGETYAGGIFLRQMLVQKTFSEHGQVSFGRLKVALDDSDIDPSFYPGITRSEGLLHLIPDEWTEIGVSLRTDWTGFSFTSQLINGLDSSGFSSQSWVANGQQGRYGSVKFTQPALVESLDFFPMHGFALHAGIYYGETSQNRPVDDLNRPCDNTATNSQIASCGYYHAPILIRQISSHLDFEHFSTILMQLKGNLKNADKINAANEFDQTNNPGRYSPVSDEAMATSLEVDWRLAADEGDSFTPFARIESYDTMRQEDDGSFAKKVLMSGLSYSKEKSYFYKANLAARSFANHRYRQEHTLSMSFGFFL